MPGPYKPAPQVKSAEQILVVAELDVAGALDGESVGLLPVGQGHIAVGIQPLQDARIVAAALLVGADQMRRAFLALELLVVLGAGQAAAQARAADLEVVALFNGVCLVQQRINGAGDYCW